MTHSSKTEPQPTAKKNKDRGLAPAKVLERLAATHHSLSALLRDFPELTEEQFRAALVEAAEQLRLPKPATDEKPRRKRTRKAPPDGGDEKDKEPAEPEKKVPFCYQQRDPQTNPFVHFGIEPPSSDPPPAALTIHIDGCSKGNPGPSAIGCVFLAPDGRVVAEGCAYLGEMTNNTAEYHGLISALLQAIAWRVDTVTIKTDSELLARQINGVYRIKSPGLMPLISKAQTLRRQLRYCAVRHVRREENKRADTLANLAIKRYMQQQD
jgi:ribonuclease HI